MKTAVFIDGANTYLATRHLYDIDWKVFRKYYQHRTNQMVHLLYYSAILTVDGQATILPLLDWLSYNGYTVVHKPAKVFNNGGIQKVKGDMDIEIAVDIVKYSYFVDHIVLYTGDGDFVPAVKAAQDRGVFVTVVSTMNVVADELRRAANDFADLRDLQQEFLRAS